MTENRNNYHVTDPVNRVSDPASSMSSSSMGSLEVPGRTEAAQEEIADQLRKEWENAGIGNAFIFGKIMTTRPDLLLELLQYSLPEMQIQSICDVRREVDIKLAIDARGVRLDVAVHDNTGRMIDVEMQLKDEKNIPRRMRYYFGAVDQTILEIGEEYRKLRESVIVFITPFDPFGKGLIRYTFRSICLEDRELELGDGTTGVILNAAGTQGNVSHELRDFLNLVSGLQNYEKDSFADRIQEQVIRARQNSEWRRQYMDWKMTLLSERSKGREEGVLLERISTITQKVKRGVELSQIADAMEKDTETIRPIYDAVKAAAPDYDSEKILQKLRETIKADSIGAKGTVF